MSLAILSSGVLLGFDLIPVRVEVHVGTGLPSFTIVGMPDVGVRESRERVRAAILNSGYSFPAARITVNLAPADIPKDSGRFDLAIALGVLLASGQLQREESTPTAQAEPPDMDPYFFAGELSLTGAVVVVGNALALARGVLQQFPQKTVVLPLASARIAAHVPGAKIVAVHSLPHAVQFLCGAEPAEPVQKSPLSAPTQHSACLSEVQGQQQGRLALEYAASGGHSLLFSGPPGVGKSMLAQRLPGLLPALDSQQQLDVAILYQMQSHAESSLQLTAIPPYRAPHHSCSMAAMVGGGRVIRPGEISLAHHGVLFMDELPEFDRRVLESLREPLETGEILVSRINQRCRFPAQFQLVAAMNPCPCGYFGHKQLLCRCSADQVMRYQQKLSGPLLDRIDLFVMLPYEPQPKVAMATSEGSDSVRQRVLRARQKQKERQGCLNAHLHGEALQHYVQLTHDAEQLLNHAAQKWSWSLRVVHRVQRVSRTIADVAESTETRAEHVALAMQFRDQMHANSL
ncbi:hypothetical protein PAEH1_01070 [Paenalcaligenes hominis]|uniref:AAA+ ATPase domain-containing protein n=1 Tax=Paenalcaligenes hominis TaxID=643674 RepID=A0A1U9JXF5_9BURK|nr:YifB family Mg chelatase-like AAA ATPase [Paenalcaligenes hominis]AQS50480.1 hypothetical protein PAEH1_01070 [Paenalcaligenes hominis]